MRRYLAVRLDEPPGTYASLFRLRGSRRRSRQLAPLHRGQREAIVTVVLLGGASGATGGTGAPPRLLETLYEFRIPDLPNAADKNPEIILDARYDGRRRVDLKVAVGRSRYAASVRVRGERSKSWWLLLLIPLLLVTARLTVGNRAREARMERNPTQRQPDPGREPMVERAPEPEEGAAEQPQGEGDSMLNSGSEGVEPGPPERESLSQREYRLYFEADSTELTAVARSQLTEIAEVLPENGATQVRIIGHTALFGTEEGRIEISRGRAERVYRFLLEAGWEPSSPPTLAWEASREPVTRVAGEQWRNRRVEIEVDGTETE